MSFAQGIEAESPDDDRREEEDLQRKARPPRRAGVAPECVAGNPAFYCFKCGGPGGLITSPHEQALTHPGGREFLSKKHPVA
ncbi:MAG: hypothetical protein LBH90_02910 [Tannerella sp.]|nr:hypothetical protein [Tannerella sp.]